MSYEPTVGDWVRNTALSHNNVGRVLKVSGAYLFVTDLDGDARHWNVSLCAPWQPIAGDRIAWRYKNSNDIGTAVNGISGTPVVDASAAIGGPTVRASWDKDDGAESTVSLCNCIPLEREEKPGTPEPSIELSGGSTEIRKHTGGLRLDNDGVVVAEAEPTSLKSPCSTCKGTRRVESVGLFASMLVSAPCPDCQ